MRQEQSFLTEARSAFIRDGVELPGVRSAVIAGWRRSRAAGAPITPESMLAVDERELSDTSSLVRAARPVIEARMQQFRTLDFAMMIVNREGRIVGRWHTTGAMAELLDRQAVQIGALFDEPSVGTTALGTPLELGTIAFVEGAEHYNGSFDDVVAAGAPIANPGTGVIEGVVDIVCPLGVPVEFMVSVVSAAAAEIGTQLVNGYAREDRELLDAFLRCERRGPRRPVVAVNRRILITNAVSGDIVGAQDHQALWSGAYSAITTGQHDIDVVTRDDDGMRRGRIQEVIKGSSSAGVVVQFSVGSRRSPSPGRPGVEKSAALAHQLSQALSGRSRLWEATLNEVARAVVGRQWMLLSGRPGIGKTTLAETALRCHFGIEVPMVVEATELPSSTGHVDSLIIDGLDRIEPDRVDEVADWLEALPSPRPYVIGCTRDAVPADQAGSRGDAQAERLLSLFEKRVTIPALARRESDIEELVAAWALQRDVHVAPDAVKELASRTWLGNVRQLHRVLEAAATAADGRTITRDALPGKGGERPAFSRRLTYLESVERDAIASLLDAFGGDKVKVAQELGIARSTLYRKLAALDLG